MEAVKLGSATVGIKNGTHAVIVALKRAASELSAYQKKIYEIDDHLGMSMAGLTADARVISRYLRTECLNYKYVHDSPHPVTRLLTKLGNKMQTCTQRYDKRPYGVGLLIAGFDDAGPYVYQTCPSANFYNCKAMAIGSRSQSARTYLEKHLDEFAECSTDDLIAHALRSLRDTLPNESELSEKNVAIGLVGKDTRFREFDEEEMKKYLAVVVGEERRAAPTISGDTPPGPPPSGPSATPSATPAVAVAMETE